MARKWLFGFLSPKNTHQRHSPGGHSLVYGQNIDIGVQHDQASLKEHGRRRNVSHVCGVTFCMCGSLSQDMNWTFNSFTTSVAL